MDKDLLQQFRIIVLPEFWNTAYMVIITLAVSTIFGFVLAIALFVTEPKGLKPNGLINKILNIIVNTIRSFPFVILVVAIIPFTRFVVGTSIGKKAALVPLTITTTSYLSRLIEANLKEIDYSLVEAGKSFGATNIQIIFKIIVFETMPSIISSLTYITVSILGLSAMAGVVGGGGLGAVARTYGYQNFNYEVMYGTVLLIIIIVQVIQFIGKILYEKARI